MKILIIVVAIFASINTHATMSLTGKFESKVEQQSGAAYVEHDLDLSFKASVGGTSVTMMLEDIGRDIYFDGAADYDVLATQVFVETNLEGISFKAGTYETTSGNGIINAASNGDKTTLATSIAGVSVSLNTANADQNSKLTLAGNVAGVDIKVQDATRSTRFVTVSGDVAGVAVAIERQKTATGTNTGFNLSTDINGVAVAYENVKINDASAVSQDDGVIGDISAATDKASAISATMNTAMGSIEIKHAKIDTVKTHTVELTRGNVVYGYSKTTDLDKELSAKVSFAF